MLGGKSCEIADGKTLAGSNHGTQVPPAVPLLQDIPEVSSRNGLFSAPPLGEPSTPSTPPTTYSPGSEYVDIQSYEREEDEDTEANEREKDAPPLTPFRLARAS